MSLRWVFPDLALIMDTKTSALRHFSLWVKPLGKTIDRKANLADRALQRFEAAARLRFADSKCPTRDRCHYQRRIRSAAGAVSLAEAARRRQERKAIEDWVAGGQQGKVFTFNGKISAARWRKTLMAFLPKDTDGRAHLDICAVRGLWAVIAWGMAVSLRSHPWWPAAQAVTVGLL
jgi:hypothetical protein